MNHKVSMTVSVDQLLTKHRPIGVPLDAKAGWCQAIHGGSQRDPVLEGVELVWVWDEDDAVLEDGVTEETPK